MPRHQQFDEDPLQALNSGLGDRHGSPRSSAAMERRRREDEAEAVDPRLMERRMSIRRVGPSSREKRDLAGAYLRSMVFGGLLFVGGTILTIATWKASENGGVYFVFYGAIFSGIGMFFRGLFGWLRHSR